MDWGLKVVLARGRAGVRGVEGNEGWGLTQFVRSKGGAHFSAV